jgi:putative endonuclease (uncharacterized protein DUF1780)
MDDREFIEETVRALEESVRFFAPENKAEGELWVATAFLENIRIPFTEGELQSPSDDPPDVLFRDARFEIKEVLDPGRKRHLEYRQALERARKATSVSELLESFEPRDTTIQAVYDICLARVVDLDRKYPPSVRAGLDLLFYVNLRGIVGLKEAPFPDVNSIASAGWRSVSFVKGQRSCCFCAARDAPAFIAKTVGRVKHLHPSN